MHESVLLLIQYNAGYSLVGLTVNGLRVKMSDWNSYPSCSVVVLFLEIYASVYSCLSVSIILFCVLCACVFFRATDVCSKIIWLSHWLIDLVILMPIFVACFVCYRLHVCHVLLLVWFWMPVCLSVCLSVCSILVWVLLPEPNWLIDRLIEQCKIDRLSIKVQQHFNKTYYSQNIVSPL